MPRENHVKTSQEALQPLTSSVIAFLVVSTFIVLARAISRHHIAKLSFWWDDLCIAAGYVAIVAMGALLLSMAQIEMRASPWDTEFSTMEEIETLAKLVYAYLVLLIFSFAATRLAILALYLRIFPSSSSSSSSPSASTSAGRGRGVDRGRQRLRRIIWAMVAFVACQYLAFTLVSVFSCWPVSTFWQPAAAGGSCIDRGIYFRTMTPFNVAVDAVLVILPLPTVWRLKATRFRKWALTVVFGLGILALVVSAIRLVEINTNHISERASPSNTNALFIWVYIEPSVYLVASCLPTMHHIVAAATPRPVSRWMAQKLTWLSRIGGKTTGGGGGGGGGFGKTTLGGGSSTEEHMPQTLPCSAADFNPYVGNDIDLEALGQEAKIEAMELSVVDTGGRRLSKIEGIMVTQEVKVTHEDRIASVIGF